MKQIFLHLLSITILMLMTACTTTGNIAKPAPVEERSSATIKNANDISDIESAAQTPASEAEQQDPDNPQSASTSPAVVALMDNAAYESTTGNNETAAISLERALRLQPKNAMLWHRLSLIQLQKHNWQQALTLARKSNSLAAGNYSLQKANWRIIARVKVAVGDKEGEKHANRMLEQLNKNN